MLQIGRSVLFLLLLAVSFAAFSQAPAKPAPPSVVLTYKQVDTVQLQLQVFTPPGYQNNKSYPAIIFFFGGGWNGGTRKQFEPQASYLASRGMVAVLADYRVKTRNKTTPFEAVADAKSAIRYLRANAQKLGIDPNRIAAGGGSAGAHLAAAADLTRLDAPGEDLAVSSRPNALVLFNPVFDNGPDGYGYERIGQRYREISPLHNITTGAAPTIVFLGTQDKLIPVETARRYQQQMQQAGSRCELFLYEGQPHGFFNKEKYQLETLKEADIFLRSLGYLKGAPTLKAL